MKFCSCIYPSYKDTKVSTEILPTDLCLCLIVQNSVPKFFFSLISVVHFGDKAVQEAGHTFLFPLGSELEGGKGRHTDIIIGFQYSRVVRTWLVAELSFQDSWKVLTRFQFFPVVTTPAPPSPNVEDSPSHTEPVWPSHVPFLDTSSVLLARGGHVLHRAGQRSSVSKEGKWYQCLPQGAFTFYLFRAIKFVFKWFPVTFTSLMLSGWLLLFICYNLTGGIFPKDKSDFIISFLFPQCGLREWSRSGLCTPFQHFFFHVACLVFMFSLAAVSLFYCLPRKYLPSSTSLYFFPQASFCLSFKTQCFEKLLLTPCPTKLKSFLLSFHSTSWEFLQQPVSLYYDLFVYIIRQSFGPSLRFVRLGTDSSLYCL